MVESDLLTRFLKCNSLGRFQCSFNSCMFVRRESVERAKSQFYVPWEDEM